MDEIEIWQRIARDAAPEAPAALIYDGAMKLRARAASRGEAHLDGAITHLERLRKYHLAQARDAVRKEWAAAGRREVLNGGALDAAAIEKVARERPWLILGGATGAGGAPRAAARAKLAPADAARKAFRAQPAKAKPGAGSAGPDHVAARAIARWLRLSREARREDARSGAWGVDLLARCLDFEAAAVGCPMGVREADEHGEALPEPVPTSHVIARAVIDRGLDSEGMLDDLSRVLAPVLRQRNDGSPVALAGREAGAQRAILALGRGARS